MKRDNDLLRFFHVGDVVEREDGGRGTVLEGGTIRVRVAWEDGVFTEIEQHDRAYSVVARVYKSSDEATEVAMLRAEADRLQAEADGLRSEAIALENRSTDLELRADEIEHAARKYANQLSGFRPGWADE